jgi:hypothetical protein
MPAAIEVRQGTYVTCLGKAACQHTHKLCGSSWLFGSIPKDDCVVPG